VFYTVRWIKLDLTCIYFQKKINSLLLLISTVHLKQLNRPRGFSSFFGLVRFTLTQLTSSPPFLLPGVASPLADVITLPHRVTLPSHWTKMSSLSLFHLSVMVHPVAFPLEPKPKYWICTSTVGHPPRTARFPYSTAIKRSSQSWSLSLTLNRVFSFCLPASQIITSSKLYSPPLFSFTVVPRQWFIHTMTLTSMN
jgi:hypothetical protein